MLFNLNSPGFKSLTINKLDHSSISDKQDRVIVSANSGILTFAEFIFSRHRMKALIMVDYPFITLFGLTYTLKKYPIISYYGDKHA